MDYNGQEGVKISFKEFSFSSRQHDEERSFNQGNIRWDTSESRGK